MNQRELRNNHKPLLRRLQRQLDLKNSSEKTIPSNNNNGPFLLHIFDDININEEERIILKKTKLCLYNRRSGR